jgi:hypothetical protein
MKCAKRVGSEYQQLCCALTLQLSLWIDLTSVSLRKRKEPGLAENLFSVLSTKTPWKSLAEETR